MPDAPRVIQLSPADWKQLVLLNVEQLHQFIASIPANTEAGNSALTDEQLQLVGAIALRVEQLLHGWKRARMVELTKPEPVQVAQPQTNGVHEPKKHGGGWPKGKPRKPKDEQAGRAQ